MKIWKLQRYSPGRSMPLLNVETVGEGAVSEEVVQESGDLQDYEFETVVELTANPADGWMFREWAGDLGGDENPATIEIDEEKNVTAIFEEGEEIVLDITVDWQYVAEIQSDALGALGGWPQGSLTNDITEEEITHFGVRIEDEEQSAIVKQSVEQETAEEEGIITIELPPSFRGDLQAVTARYGGDFDNVWHFGVLEDFSPTDFEDREIPFRRPGLGPD